MIETPLGTLFTQKPFVGCVVVEYAGRESNVTVTTPGPLAVAEQLVRKMLPLPVRASGPLVATAGAAPTTVTAGTAHAAPVRTERRCSRSGDCLPS